MILLALSGRTQVAQLHHLRRTTTGTVGGGSYKGVARPYGYGG